MSKKITFFHQLNSSDCGLASLAMILSYYGKIYKLEDLKPLFEFTRNGISIKDILLISNKLGLDSHALKLSIDELDEIPHPVILHWKQNHYVVLEKIKNNKYYILDPSYGRLELELEFFKNGWLSNKTHGVVIYSELVNNNVEILKKSNNKNNFYTNQIFRFIKQNKFRYIVSIIFILISLITSWFIPFTFQWVVDKGILKKDLNIVYILLCAQFILFISNFISSYFSNIVLTKLNFVLSISLKNNLLYKLISLPINYFDSRLNTETLQRINDQNTIQSYFTWKGVDFILNILNILVFSTILIYLNVKIFSVFILFSVIGVFWITFFLKKRKALEYSSFIRKAENNNLLYEFIMNMVEIKINNAQNRIISKLLNVQQKQNDIDLKNLFLNMNQLLGVNFITKIKEIIVIGICALFILEGKMNIGVLLSITYVMGQLTTPINSLINFIKDTQDFNIAKSRVEDIYENENENVGNRKKMHSSKINNINIDSVSFKYPGTSNNEVLNNISFRLKSNTVTAIVGASGSGKTTLIKSILGYYKLSSGVISFNDIDIGSLDLDDLRSRCGIVMQDGHIFSGNIYENVAFSDDKIDKEKVIEACKIACIDSYINTLPMNYYTKIGNIGVELSGGQKQRILIARAIYKDPQILILDEATSALDSENERVIHDNLQKLFKNKIVLIIAHRLSTVKNADQIIVLDQGNLVELGTHESLLKNNKKYFDLINSQLESQKNILKI